MVMSEKGKKIWLHIGDSKDSDFPFWQNVTPIWVNAENQGLKTAVIGWPGAEALILFFNHFKIFNSEVSRFLFTEK